MKNLNRYTPNRLKDWIIDCDTCGAPCWFSESKLLDIDTGFGGARVCNTHSYPTDYGLVPWIVPAEQTVTETRYLANFNDNENIEGTPPFDLSTDDPLSSN